MKLIGTDKASTAAQDRVPRVIRVPEMCHLLGGISEMTLYRWENLGKFPRRKRFGPNIVGWTDETYRAHIAAVDGGTIPPQAA